MTAIETHLLAAFETTLTGNVGPNDIVFPVVTTGGGTSPMYLVFEPTNDARREIVLCDGAFDAATFRSTSLAKRYLTGSAAGSGLTHASGTVVRCCPVPQHFEDIYDLITAADLRGLVDAKGDLLVGTAADTVGRLPAPADDSVLMADSSLPSGWKGAPLAVVDTVADVAATESAGVTDTLARGDHVHRGIPTTLVDAKGDLLVGTAADTVGRLPAPADDSVLMADSTAATGWKAAAPADASTIADVTTGAESAGVTDTLARGDHVHHVDPATVGMTGEMRMWPGAAAPAGWHFCDGSQRSDGAPGQAGAALYAVIGTTYGGTGPADFLLPNLKGRFPVMPDAAQAEFNVLGETGGAKAVALTTAQLPSHTHVQDPHDHNLTDPGHTHDVFLAESGNFVDGATNAVPSNTNGGTTDSGSSVTGINIVPATATNQPTGSGETHNNLPPYLAVNFIIKL
ncbi:MAG TPA: tail fiber protein [Acidimicrobiales bacterium]|nr:tail fiber protein [Acidimicrobiales bacterium]